LKTAGLTTTPLERRLQSALGDGFVVLEEGFNGRTFIHYDPTEGVIKTA
jgi:hypothetical protein